MKLSCLSAPLFMATAIFLMPLPAFAAQTCADIWQGSYSQPYSPQVIENYEQPEYVNGLLTIHFHLATSTLHNLFHSAQLLDDMCHVFQSLPSSGPGLNVVFPEGTKNFSVRFTSLTHYEIWLDDTNTKLECEACFLGLPEIPEHFSVILGFWNNFSFNTLQTKAYSIREPQPGSPIQTDSIPKLDSCPEFETHGGDELDSYPFFDDYRVARYENGILNHHFRFINGRPLKSVWPQWDLTFSVYDEDCNYVGDVLTPEGMPRGYPVYIEPYSRYWSVRFTSPTHFEVWNDDLNRKATCEQCEGDLDLSAFSHIQNPRIQIKGDNSTTIYFGRNYSFKSVPFPVEEVQSKTLDPVLSFQEF